MSLSAFLHLLLFFFRYDWSPGALADGVFDASLAQGSEYIPMIWGEGALTEERVRHLAWIGDSAPYLLGFNEPNFKAPQAKLLPLLGNYSGNVYE